MKFFNFWGSYTYTYIILAIGVFYEILKISSMQKKIKLHRYISIFFLTIPRGF